MEMREATSGLLILPASSQPTHLAPSARSRVGHRARNVCSPFLAVDRLRTST